MSSPTTLSHRRRSHSASSPVPRRQTDDYRWRAPAKRSRPNSIRSPPYKTLALDQPPEKWDVEQWRRGKRARRDSMTEESSDELHGLLDSVPSSDPVMPADQSPTSGPASSLYLPSSAAAFQFFSHKPRRETHSRSRRIRPSRDASPGEADRMSSRDARRMRVDALGALHRSVAENGEGLVLRMRDWERSRSRSVRPEKSIPPSPYPRGTGTRPSPRPVSLYGIPQSPQIAEERSEDEDEDDIFIVGAASLVPNPSSPAHKKRAFSLSMMDVEMGTPSSSFAHLGDSDRSYSPTDRSSGTSAYSSDDEGHAEMDTDLSSSALFSTPALSHTYSLSTNSSVVSLSLSAQVGECSNTAFVTSTSVTPGNRSPSPFLPSTASRSEKAIAALTLAMANGAAGISDYDAARMCEELTTLDASHAGELWS